MNVAGIDAHATYLVVAIVSKTGELLQEPTRIANGNGAKLLALFSRFGPLEAVVETSPAWSWLYDLLTGHGHGFVLADAKKLRVIAESNYKRDEIDAELIARMRLAGIIPAVHAKDIETREQATLLRHRARLVRTHWVLIRSLSVMIRALPHARELVGYAGLAPRSARSGLRPARYGQIPAGANRWLRSAFVQGVVSHVRLVYR